MTAAYIILAYFLGMLTTVGLFLLVVHFGNQYYGIKSPDQPKKDPRK